MQQSSRSHKNRKIEEIEHIAPGPTKKIGELQKFGRSRLQA
jgi:hypothetical protein